MARRAALIKRLIMEIQQQAVPSRKIAGLSTHGIVFNDFQHAGGLRARSYFQAMTVCR